MREKTHEKLDSICTDICENICHWPYIIEDQEEMDEKCASCRPLLDLANLYEKLERKSRPKAASGISRNKYITDNNNNQGGNIA